MASRVNVKFVVILGVTMVVLLGTVAAVWLLVVKKTGDDYMRMGDTALAANDLKLAEEYYSKGVNHDNSRVDWMRKWHDVLVQITPATRTAYQSEYTGTYLPLLQAIIRAEPTNVANHAALLQEYLDISPDEISRGRAEQIATVTEDALAWFEEDPNADASWPTLKRYRGLAFERLGMSGVRLTTEERERTLADLRAAVQANPIDVDSVVALSRLLTEVGKTQREAQNREGSEAAYAEAISVVESYLEKRPGNPNGLAHLLFAKYDAQVSRETWGMLVTERTSKAREILDQYTDEAEAVFDAAESAEPTSLDPAMVVRLRALETSILDSTRLERTRAVTEDMLTANPEDARLALLSANLFQGVGEIDRTSEILSRIAAMPNLPLSVEGLLRFSYRIEAIQRQAVLVLTRAIGGEDVSPEEKTTLIEEGSALRTQLAEQVPEDASVLTFIDGLVAEAGGNYPEALRLYEQYNRQTRNNDTRSLWRQGQVARRVDQKGKARDSFEALVTLQPSNVGAMEALAQIYVQLEDLPRALALYRQLKDYLPENEKIDEVISRLSAAVDPSAAGGDPVTAVITRGRNLRFGTREQPADVAEAESVLAAGAEANGWNMQIATELIDVRIANGDFEGARDAFAKAAQANPDSPQLERLRTIVESTDLTDAALRMIAQADVSDVQKELARYPVLMRAGRRDEAREALARAAQLEPENPSVIERQFIEALEAEDMSRAQTLAQKAGELDLDRVGGASFDARLEAARGNPDRAIERLQTVVAQGLATPPIYRLLASVQRGSGNAQAAAATLETSLSLKPDDPTAVTDYITALIASGQAEKALTEARRLQPFGRSVPEFVNNWLNLESQFGGEAGRTLATDRRELIAQSSPNDRLNKASLASLYIDARRWQDARTLIDELRASEDSVGLALLDARWHADQGQVIQADGTAADGLELARGVFGNYIVSLPPEDVTAEMYVALARFMMQRDRIDIALQALEQATPLQDPSTREADKLRANLLLDRRQFAMAEPIYKEIVEGGADDSDQNYRMRWAESLLQQGKPEEAKVVFEGMREDRRSDVTFLMQTAQAALDSGDVNTARAIIDEAIAKHPQNPTVWIRRALINMGEPGMDRDVLADLNQSILLDRTNWQALRARGVFYFSQGRADEALSDLMAAVRANPNLDQVLIGVVRELLARDRDSEALDLVNYVVEQRRYNVPLIVSMSDNFALLDQWSRAAGLLEKGWTRSQNPAVGLRYIEALIRQSSPKAAEARRVYERMTRLVPEASTNAQMMTIDAMVLRAEGRPNSASRRMKEAYALVRENPPAILSWGTFSDRVHAAEGKPDEVQLIQELIDSEQADSPQRRWLRLLLADRLFDLPGERERSLSIYRQLRESGDTEDPTVLFAYRLGGTKLYSVDRADEALELWQEGLEKFPEDWEIANNVAYLLVEEKNDAESALPFAEIAVAKRANSSATQDTLANVYLALGKLDEAEETARQADALAGSIRERANALITLTRTAAARWKGGDQGSRKIARDRFIEFRTLVLSTGMGDDFEDDLEELDAATSESSSG